MKEITQDIPESKGRRDSKSALQDECKRPTWFLVGVEVTGEGVGGSAFLQTCMPKWSALYLHWIDSLAGYNLGWK